MQTQYTRTLAINGIELEVKITIEVGEDDIHPSDDFDFGDLEENATYLDRFKTGELFIAVITVKAEALGLTGMDVLGGCHVHSNNMFNSDPYEQDIEELIRSHCMESEAIEDLKTIITKTANQLKPFANRSA